MWASDELKPECCNARSSPTTKKYLAQNVSPGKAEKGCSKATKSHLLFQITSSERLVNKFSDG